jgi:choline dehydrogenase
MQSFDFIIVGAGSAGCVLANRLSADPQNRVLLLEAGGKDDRPLMAMPLAWRDTFMDPVVNWGFLSEPEPHADNRQIPAPRGKVLGGSSSVNGMMYSRGYAVDYDHWRQLGLKGWSYAEVLPYFKKSENNWRGENAWHGSGGELSVARHRPDRIISPAMAKTAQALGYKVLEDFHAADAEGFSTPEFTVHQGRRGSTSARFLHPVLGRPNLKVETLALTHRVLIEKGRAIGVEYEQGGEVRRAMADREVILSGGTFNSPQLLLLSGVGPADELSEHGIAPVHDLKGVGKNLQDHASIGMIWKARGEIGFDSKLRLDRLMLSVLQWRLFGSGDVAGLPVSAQGFYRTRPELEWPDVQFLITPVSMLAKPWFPLWRKGVGHVMSCANVLLRPESRGEVTLRSADPKEKPKIRFNLLKAQSDRETFRRMVRFGRRFFETEPASGLVEGPVMPPADVQTDEEIDAFVRKFIGTAMHPTSTCAMGTGEDAVLDESLAVRGLEGLRVVDASVMPTIVGGNTNAPVIMIAEKAADVILGKAPLAPAAVDHAA